MSERIDEVQATVRIMLEAAGLAPSPEELDLIVASYPLFKQRIESLYAIADSRYEVPGVIFDPDPAFADWAS